MYADVSIFLSRVLSMQHFALSDHSLTHVVLCVCICICSQAQ